MLSDFSQTYQADFRQWRSGRKPWSQLIQAVKAERDNGELQQLASEAGVDPAELSELRMIRRNAKQREAEAAKFSAASKKLAAMDAEIVKHRAAAEKASADQHGLAMGALGEAVAQRDRFWLTEVCGPEQAARYIETVARPLGLA